jgi:hypothetical protein
MQAIVCRLSVVGCQLVNSEFGEDDWGAWNTDKCTETNGAKDIRNLGRFMLRRGFGSQRRVSALSSIDKSENGEYLKSIAYGTNGNRLEAYPTLRRRLAAVGPR